MMPESRTQRALLLFLGVGMLGAGAELGLLGHYDGVGQCVPLGALTLGLVALAWSSLNCTRASMRSLSGVMILFVAVGLVGLWMHFKGNIEFEREMYPTMRGASLFWAALRGATPTLAPATMIFLGCLGLVYSFLRTPTREVT